MRSGGTFVTVCGIDLCVCGACIACLDECLSLGLMF